MSSGVSGCRDGTVCAKLHSGLLVTTQSRKIRSSRREAGSTERNRPPRVWMCATLSKVASFESATYYQSTVPMKANRWSQVSRWVVTSAVLPSTTRNAIGTAPSPETVRIHTSSVSYTHLRAHETDSYLVCRLLLEKKKK